MVLTAGGCSERQRRPAAPVPAGPGMLVGASRVRPARRRPDRPRATAAPTRRCGPATSPGCRAAARYSRQLRPLSLLRVTAATSRSVLARVADWGTGGGPVDGHPGPSTCGGRPPIELGLPGSSGSLARARTVSRAPASGAGNVLSQTRPRRSRPTSERRLRAAHRRQPAARPASARGSSPTGRPLHPPTLRRRSRRRSPPPTRSTPSPTPSPDSTTTRTSPTPGPRTTAPASASYVLWRAGLHGQAADDSGALEAGASPAPASGSRSTPIAATRGS